jgi:hypothetical protein
LAIDNYLIDDSLWDITGLKKVKSNNWQRCPKKKSRPAGFAGRDFFLF